ncbi:Cell division and transport-associated protein TolA (TC 2.C.1.2.1) [Pseudidiomarina indica]|uniref:Cell division and transport-associated protein TolA (TC 2.C.1.2.1) n=1 Tax=Pseudidiomarina indica TaxID=1159017 RepID=A0A1G6BK10_9GAMM|nr:cell envelope integrity protein TolA [Pseudidiomarina indica]SDB20970.1 Cell division and transport-associated protein TolA (TC 2.C.1.2.1) [Pseudidiomarina indica]
MAKKVGSWRKEWTVPLLLSVAVHLGIVVLLAFGMNFKWPVDSLHMPATVISTEQPDEEQVEIVQAVTVDQAAVEQRVQEIRERERQQQLQEERRQAELERRAEEARKAREKEQQQLRELQKQQEEERRRLEQEKVAAQKEREAAEKAAAEAAERRKREEEAARKAEEERKRKEAEARKAEEERQRREQEAKERAERERQLQEQLQREAAQRQRARQQQVQSEVERYSALIRETVRRNWIVDDSMRGKECRLSITLSRSGFVTSVNEGQGDRAVCESARRAILRIGTLPMSQDPEVYEQMKSITFPFIAE